MTIKTEIEELKKVLAAHSYMKTPRGDGSTREFVAQLIEGPVPLSEIHEIGSNLINKTRAYFCHHKIGLTVKIDGGMCSLDIRGRR